MKLDPPPRPQNWGVSILCLHSTLLVLILHYVCLRHVVLVLNIFFYFQQFSFSQQTMFTIDQGS